MIIMFEKIKQYFGKKKFTQKNISKTSKESIKLIADDLDEYIVDKGLDYDDWYVKESFTNEKDLETGVFREGTRIHAIIYDDYNDKYDVWYYRPQT